MGSEHAGRRGIARLLAVCAVLFGLFLMHGAPATAGQGCHGAMPTMAPSPITGGHDPALLATRAPAVPTPGFAVRAAGLSGMPGSLCVSTPAHERIPLPAPGLIDVAGAAALTPWMLTRLRAAASRTGRRGPPDSGRDLLLQVCIART
ncbi:hypothetical protein [Streptomyces sp. 351MFTsu5.1]|uniref:hypothetical protein n=1 Tax=Streptomyces sp. 351MFTsu5.1 TaxID=1172180 RepID=UPI00036BC034|nr:hypothetical protein [Streptomyces sp. 351MFTsu5.1]